MIVFISYSSKNREIVIQLAALLTEMGYDVRYDQRIGTGDDWWSHILADIRASSVVLYALSPEYLDSYPCELEYNYAVALNRPVLPVMITPVDFGQTPTYIAKAQVLKFTDLTNPILLSRLVGQLRTLEQQPKPLPFLLPPEPMVPISKLNAVIEQVADFTVTLTHDAQKALLGDIRPYLYNRDTRANARYALQKYHKRSDVGGPLDLYADITYEIDSLLETYAGNVTPSQPMRTALMILLIILVVSGIGVGGWLATHSAATPTNTPAPIAQVGSPTQGASSSNTSTSIQTAIPTRTAVPLDTEAPSPIPPSAVPTDVPPAVLAITYDAQDTQTEAANETATATLSTKTPTPSRTFTLDAPGTAHALQTITATQKTATRAAGLTQTATLWTKTYTPTLTPSSTPFPTVTANNQWTPIPQSIGGAPMILVPPGCFMLGSDPAKDLQAYKDEQPQTKICFTQPFWIDQFPVWQAQFRQFNGQAVSSSYFTSDNHPVEQITWFEAQRYCEQQRGGRLPTETEYEYAARGPDDPIYPWGNTFVADNVVDSGNANLTGIVGPGIRSKGASWVGALDMIGNVWEWTSSIYKPYPYVGSDGREDNNDIKSARVVRGGSWTLNTNLVRAAVRYGNDPSVEVINNGFRCVRSY